MARGSSSADRVPRDADSADPLRPATAGDRLVFIAGVHRSGTSLLHGILRSHPQFSGFRDTGAPQDEGQHLQDVFPPAKAFGGPGQFGFDPASFMDENHPLATPVSAAQLLEQWAPHWDTEKPLLLEKSPPNLVRTRFLQALFPGCSFVVVLRHPVAVAYATKKWSRNSIPRLTEHTLICYERFFADAPRLSRVHILRYEELVEQPRERIGALLDWLEAEPHEAELGVRADLNARYFARWQADLRSPARRLAGKLTNRATTLAALEERTQAFGYSLRVPEKLAPIRSPGEDLPGGG